MRFPALIAAAFAAPILCGGAAAQTQFDGTYAGVSMTLSPGPGTRSCGQYNGAPTLTISGGRGQANWGTTGMLTGTVSPQGAVMLRNDFGATLSAQIDARGTVRGTIGANCRYDAVWQKR